LLYEGPSEEPTKLYDRASINSGSEQLQILGNNLTQQLMLGCQLHGEKGPEGTKFHNAYIQKGE
jgi:hypothetical protein